MSVTNCESCRFFSHKSQASPAEGYCYRFPPDGAGRVSLTHPHSRCGEWQRCTELAPPRPDHLELDQRRDVVTLTNREWEALTELVLEARIVARHDPGYRPLVRAIRNVDAFLKNPSLHDRLEELPHRPSAEDPPT